VSAAKLVIRQVRSANGADRRQLATLRALGLGRIGRTAERPDTAIVRGQLRTVRHLVEIEEVPAAR